MEKKKSVYVFLTLFVALLVLLGIFIFPFVHDYISVTKKRVLPKYAKEVRREKRKISYSEVFCESDSQDECPDEIETDSIEYKGRFYTIVIFAPVENGEIRIPRMKKDVEDSSYPDGVNHGEFGEFNYHIQIFFRDKYNPVPVYTEGAGG